MSTTRSRPRVERVPDLLTEAAALVPDRKAYVTLGRDELTFGAWQDRSSRLGAALSSDICCGDRVLVLCSPETWCAHLVAYVGIQRAGAVPVPVSSASSPHELDSVADAVAPAAAVAGDAEAASAAARAGIEARTVAELCEARLDERAKDRLARARHHPDADILFTTGTTGVPKPVVTTHSNLLHGTGGAPPVWDGWPIVHTMPPYAAAGAQGIAMLVLGGRLCGVGVPQLTLEALRRAVEQHGGRILWTTPSVLRFLVEAGSIDEPWLRRFEYVFSVGSSVSPAVLEALAAALPRTMLLNVYGLTEAGGAQTVMPYDRSRPGSVGRPSGLTLVEIRAVDGACAAPGEIGEIWLRRRGTQPRSYFRDSAASRDVFRGGWTRTGDLGYVDDDGYLYLVDRKKNIIVRDGTNISPFEVEAVLAQHPAVVDAAVVGLPDPVHGQRVGAVVVTGSVRPTSGELRRFCRERLSRSKTPREFFVADALPRNELGKIVHEQLRAAVRDNRLQKLSP